MADGVVQVPVDSTGKKIDTSELTRPDTTVVERQRITIGDPTTFANQATVTASGALKIDGSAVTQPVSGTVTANQGGAPWSDNITQFGGTNLATGTGAGGAGIPRVTVSNDSNILATQSGSWSVTANAGTNLNTSLLALDTSVNGILLSQGSTTSGQKGSLAQGAVTTSAPSYTTAQTSPLSLDTSGNLRVSLQASGATVTVSGTVTANAGTNLNTSALALDTSVNGILLAQASTTSGQKGPLIQGAVTTNAPSYTTAQSDPLSLDTSGLLRVSIKDTPSNTNNFNVALAASSATVTVTATNLSTNVAQFGGTNVVTGTGAGGSGIPRVTVSNDSNVLATQSGTWTVQPGNTANTTPWLATINQGGNSATVTASNALKVDGSAVTQPVSGTVTSNQGGAPWSVVGTLTNNNASPGANNVGALIALAGSANPSYTSGDQVLLSTDLSGNLRVTGSLSVGGTTDDATFTAGTSTGTPAMGAYQTTVSPLSNNQLGIVALDANRNMKVSIAAAGGTLSVAHAGPQPVYLDDQNTVLDDQGILYVNTAVDGADIATGANQAAQTALLTQIAAGAPVSQQGAWNISATVSNFPSSQNVAIASNAPLAVYLDDRNVVLDDNGIPYVNINLDGADIYTPLQQLAGYVGPTSLPVPASAGYIAGNASTSLPTAAPAGNLTGVMTDKFGRQVVLNSTIRDLVGTQTTTISASTSETTIVTANASVFNDLFMLIVSNTSASTNTRIDFRDTTGGTVLFSLQSNGGQPPIGFTLPTPIPQTGVNTNWTATCATSTTDIRIYAAFAKNR